MPSRIAGENSSIRPAAFACALPLQQHSRSSLCTNSDADNGFAELEFGIRHDFYVNFTIPRPVKFAQENGLPASQAKTAVFDPYLLRTSDQRGFNVRVRIS